VLSWMLAKLGLNRYMWHQSLFHLAFFVCLFATMALQIY